MQGQRSSLSDRWNLLRLSALSQRQTGRHHSSRIPPHHSNMDNFSNAIDEGIVFEEHRDGAHSPEHDPKRESYSEVQVHVSADAPQHNSLDYMDTREDDQHSSSSSSSSGEEEREEKEAGRDEEPAVEVEVEKVNGDGSRRSSSASSTSPGDPCDDAPIQPRFLEEENTEDGMLMAHSSKPDESVDYRLATLEDDGAPADPSQPDISLYVKVR